MDRQFYELSSKFQEMQNQLEQAHEEELQKFQEEFEHKNNGIYNDKHNCHPPDIIYVVFSHTYPTFAMIFNIL